MFENAARISEEAEPVLPQMEDRMFLTDGGLETTLIYHEDWDLPEFASFPLLDSASGVNSLTSYYHGYIGLALKYGTGLILESPTWRASKRWGSKLGYSSPELADINRRAIALMAGLRRAYRTPGIPMVVSGNIGPYDDGYSPREHLGVSAAHEYHSEQIATFAETEADMVCAMTLTYGDEAIGVTRAAQQANIPCAISFTVELNGCLPSGETLAEAIERVDAETWHGPAYYMVNCAHPTHFIDKLRVEGAWKNRIRGVRANASCMSHAELDASTVLDDGNPQVLAEQYAELQACLPNLRVLGGCCGTDHRHIHAISEHCVKREAVIGV